MSKTIIIALNSAWNLFNFRSALIQSLIRSGHRVIGVAPYDNYVEKLDCEFLPLSIQSKGMNVLLELQLCWKIYRLLKKVKPDIVLTYTIKPNLYFSFVCRVLDIPVINTITGLGRAYLNDNVLSKAISFCYRLAFKKSKQVFFQNTEDLNFFLKNQMVTENNTTLVPGSGVDLNFFFPRPYFRPASHIFQFLFVGRVLVEKGIRELIQATRLLKEKGYVFQTAILGRLDHEKHSGLKADEFNQWMKDGFMNYLGAVDDVRPFLSQADCIVLPSYREGLSKALLESAAMAKPIITSNVPGCREIVEHGVNGYLSEVKNVVDLSMQMEKILNMSPQELDQMGNCGRKKIAQEYNEELVVTKYLSRIEMTLIDKFVNQA